jgi:hypothetical protein
MHHTLSEGDYKGMVSSNMITNCPITMSDITNADAIFRPDKTLPAYKEKWSVAPQLQWWQIMWRYLMH